MDSFSLTLSFSVPNHAWYLLHWILLQNPLHRELFRLNQAAKRERERERKAGTCNREEKREQKPVADVWWEWDSNFVSHFVFYSAATLLRPNYVQDCPVVSLYKPYPYPKILSQHKCNILSLSLSLSLSFRCPSCWTHKSPFLPGS